MHFNQRTITRDPANGTADIWIQVRHGQPQLFEMESATTETTIRFEMERLHKSCRRLVWLNPLLRWQGFEPKAAGIRTMLPHVDRFVPAHNLESLEQLTRLLASDTPARPH